MSGEGGAVRRKRRASQRDRQAGRVIVRRLGERGEVLVPDRGQAPMKIRLRTCQDHPRDGYGSHRNGRHKLG